jgi:protein-L-isoaspartate(D-aspartate) O-methyltransferase
MTETIDDMIAFDLRDRGIRDERVLAAFRRVDRRNFVPQMDVHRAYDDRALILSHGQTISQPYMVALMTQALELKGTERVLEIGTGSGFQCAILSCLAREVHTVERIEYLATTAEDRLLALGFTNIRFKLGDGSVGWPEHAPYDRIIVTAACPAIPKALEEQLAEGGILVAPVGPPEGQNLIIERKRDGKLNRVQGGECIFVKLVGSQGYGQTDS